MSSPKRISIEALPGMPWVHPHDDLAQVIAVTAQQNGVEFMENDVLCVASKAASTAEGHTVLLDDITPSETALRIHERVSRKDPRAIQAIIDATGDPTGSRLQVSDNYIGGWLPNGLFLTSAGVDKHGPGELILLPKDADYSARLIGKKILDMLGVNVGVIITDSEGRPDKRGSAQIAIGTYGVPPIRVSTAESDDGKVKTNEETTCDMLAASASLLMGQRGFNTPVVRIQGYEYEFDPDASISQALNGNTL